MAKEPAAKTAMAAARAQSPLMTVPECAEYLRSAPSWVRKLIAGGRLPFQRQGKAYLVLRRDLEAYVEACSSRS